MTPVDQVADDEQLRAAQAYSRRVADLAAEASRVDGLWNGFRTNCRVTLSDNAYEGSREWLSLWESVQVDLSSGYCRDLFNQIVGRGQTVNSGMAAAETEARREAAPGEEHVAHGEDRVVGGRVGEPGAARRGVADDVHVGHDGAAPAVDLHAARTGDDAEPVESQSVDVRRATGRHHDTGRRELPVDPLPLMEMALRLIEENGGAVTGELPDVAVSIPTSVGQVEGRCTLVEGALVNIQVVKKPKIVTCAMVRDKLVEYLSDAVRSHAARAAAAK